MAPLSIIDAKKIILSQEGIPLPIKRSGYRLFRHEIEKEKPVSTKKALEHVLGWMLIQAEKEARSAYRVSTIQKRILYLLAVEGFTQSQAAIELNRSHYTVKHYCINLRKQLGVDNFYQVVAIAVAQGWIPAPTLER